MNKVVKITGEREYFDIALKHMMPYIERGNGIKIGYANNHHTVQFELLDGTKLISHAYETQTMIIIGINKV